VNDEIEPVMRPESAADKTLWGFLAMLAPTPIQEITREATADERYATIGGWRHVHGRWFWNRETNTLIRANRRFVAAYHRVADLNGWDR
jgi:hypothetical protein